MATRLKGPSRFYKLSHRAPALVASRLAPAEVPCHRARMVKQPGRHLLTVDVEDWYHSMLQIPVSEWPLHEDRVVRATARLLECLERGGARATFFVLGHVAERHPELVPTIESAGHEIACHGYAHRLASRQSREAFTEDVRRGLDIVRAQASAAVIGYRAPYWSIVRECAWAIDVLAELGFAYDSSVYPTLTSLYGVPDAPTRPFRVRGPRGGELIEFPPSVVPLPGRNLPFAGGIYLRLLPYACVRAGMRWFEKKREPAVVYIHPPEFDPDKPKVPLPWAERVLHYARLDAMRVKVPRLLDEFEFVPIRDYLHEHLDEAKLQRWSLGLC